MSKKNGKWVVTAIIGFVFLISLIAVVVQKQINANRGKPASSAETASETAAE
ncbi:hypothetical protein [Pelagicoccus sp. SDUM812003]|uniref:hypothetical protein n=1 Tax=Pelagicoccus sp. SDUM812003 TaxID=3041267 RepID=UPI00280D0D81|nr:hypothetical protein [Pelagicoccus sp. SDUM812003]MDQ8205274.1 hypothetical protein [Pelagicoccus sp. SDUM812003]